MESRIKYVVHPGWVRSKADGDRHFIGFHMLCRLYHVNPIECIDAGSGHAMRGWSDEAFATLKHLHPNHHDKYTLEAE